jgi:hypothetical protein
MSGNLPGNIKRRTIYLRLTKNGASFQAASTQKGSPQPRVPGPLLADMARAFLARNVFTYREEGPLGLKNKKIRGKNEVFT